MARAATTTRSQQPPGELPGEAFAPSGAFIELPGCGTCFYRWHHNPGKPTLLLLHGMAATSGLNWFRVFPSLQPHFNIIAPDIRGHGRSQPGPDRFSFDNVADDMACLLEALETGPVIALGYSMGGAVAQYLWHRHRALVAGLVLAASNYRARVARHEEMVALPAFAAIVGIGRITEVFGHLPRGLIKRFLPTLADTLHESDMRWALDEFRRSRLRTIAETAREMALHDARHWLHQIDVPTAVVIPDNDRVIPPAHQHEMAGLIEDARVFTHAGGHFASGDPEFGETLASASLYVQKRWQQSQRG